MTAKQTGSAVFLWSAVGAYLLWGLAPQYFKLIDSVAPIEIIAHRTIWALPVCLLFILLNKQRTELVSVLKCKQRMLRLFLAAHVLGLNWFTFVWAVNSDRVLDASLGYYINPLVNVVAAYFLLGEKFSQRQRLAVVLATAAVLFLTVQSGQFPVAALGLAFSFTIYGYIKVKLKMPAVISLFVETLLLLPSALGILVYRSSVGTLSFGNHMSESLLLAGLGVVSVLPLTLWNVGAKGLRLTTLGFLQYIGPSVMFLIAVIFYREPVTGDKLVAFILIWIALIIYSSKHIRPRSQPTLKEVEKAC